MRLIREKIAEKDLTIENYFSRWIWFLIWFKNISFIDYCPGINVHSKFHSEFKVIATQLCLSSEKVEIFNQFFLHCEFHTRCHGPGGKLPEFQFSFPSLLLTNTPLTFSPQASFSPQNSVFLFTLFDQTSAFFTFTLETFYQNTLSFLPTFTLRLWTNAPLHPFLQKCWCSKWSKTCILPN